MLGGCSQSHATREPEIGDLEIGVRDRDGLFRPYRSGDTAHVVHSGGGLDNLLVSLRVPDDDGSALDPSVTVTVEGLVMAADRDGPRFRLEYDGTGYVLWDVRVEATAEMCCYICRTGTVAAELRDASGRIHRGQVNLILSRGACPDPYACCASADYCPDPSLTLVCP